MILYFFVQNLENTLLRIAEERTAMFSTFIRAPLWFVLAMRFAVIPLTMGTLVLAGYADTAALTAVGLTLLYGILALLSHIYHLDIPAYPDWHHKAETISAGATAVFAIWLVPRYLRMDLLAAVMTLGCGIICGIAAVSLRRSMKSTPLLHWNTLVFLTPGARNSRFSSVRAAIMLLDPVRRAFVVLTVAATCNVLQRLTYSLQGVSGFRSQDARWAMFMLTIAYGMLVLLWCVQFHWLSSVDRILARITAPWRRIAP
ncbi:MAG: hypothetical protein G01um101431_306 [Parcubacteria group bacterium Gr01-1014_31]|nr:MAG: hypothetical protein G01um101431_306 [Parcubacteria group bacterium Gr01-1014_31]